MTQTEKTTQDAPPKRIARLLDSLVRHPAGAMLVGFLLTGVVGTVLTNHLATQRQQEAEASHLRDARQKAVLEMSRLFAERFIRAEMLAAALDRHASREVIERLKQLCDEAEANFQMKRPEALLLARDVLGPEDFLALRAKIETRLAKQRILPLRECLERACAAAATGGDPAAILRECNAAQLLTGCRTCSEAVLDEFYVLVSISHLDPADPRSIRVREKARKQIELACPETAKARNE